MKRLLPLAALLFMVVVWGATFTVVEDVVDRVAGATFVHLRFLVAFVALAPLAWPILRHRRALPAHFLRDAAVLGAVLAVGFLLQTWGLERIPASRSAFLTALSVLMVPIAQWLMRVDAPRPGPVAGALAAVVGLWILCDPDAVGGGFGIGDLMTLGCAAAFAAHLLLVGRVARRGFPAVPLALVQFAVVFLVSAPAVAIDPPGAALFTWPVVAAILITGLLACDAAFLCQVYAQRTISPTRVAVFLTLEPVAATVWAVLLGRETVTPALWWGGGLIVLATILAQIEWPRRHAAPAG